MHWITSLDSDMRAAGLPIAGLSEKMTDAGPGVRVDWETEPTAEQEALAAQLIADTDKVEPEVGAFINAVTADAVAAQSTVPIEFIPYLPRLHEVVAYPAERKALWAKLRGRPWMPAEAVTLIETMAVTYRLPLT